MTWGFRRQPPVAWAVIIRPVEGIDAWWSAGERVGVDLGGIARQIFVRRAGAGPTMTLLHGFPSSSHDWVTVLPALAERIRARLPTAPFTALPDVGHWPALEAPARVVEALRDGASASNP
jgi:pimeloyl-ACP methyl ester carboxylesterase